jgi:endo-1,4-beta-xylanase
MKKILKFSTLIVLITVNFIQAQKGLKDYYASYFPIGVSVSPDLFVIEPEVTLIKREFNSMTPENVMKMGLIHPKEDTYNWEPADKIIAFAQANNMKVRGHTLCWHNQVPNWLFVDNNGKEVTKEMLLARMKKHITDVVSRYKGKIYAWDVVNEAVPDTTDAIYRASKFYKIIGPEFIEKAFEYAHEADPNALLFYNDYDTEKKFKREKILTLLKGLIAKGVPIHGVGLQGHWSVYEPTAQELDESINDFVALGLKVQVTELDVSVHLRFNEPIKEKFTGVSLFTPELEQQQIAKYKMIFEVLRKHKKHISGVTFWNLSDKNTWLDRFPAAGRKDFPLLFDTNLKPKKVYKAVTIF